MDCDTTLTLIAIGGSLLGAIIGGLISFWATKRHLSATYKKQKLDVLGSQLKMLQEIHAKLYQYQINVRTLRTNALAIINFFTSHVNDFLLLSYLYPKEIEDEYLGIDAQIKKFRFTLDEGNEINEDEINNIRKEISRLDNKIYELIFDKKRKLQSEIKDLTIE